jgi:hypothetical protein
LGSQPPLASFLYGKVALNLESQWTGASLSGIGVTPNTILGQAKYQVIDGRREHSEIADGRYTVRPIG